MNRSSRIISNLAIGSLGLGLAVVAWAPPAAGAANVDLTPTTWAYTDSGRPNATFVDRAVDMPVGARREAGRLHKSRAYFTFDISQLRGQVLHEAILSTWETAVADCTTAAPVELWRTGPVTRRTSWKNPPAELERVGLVTTGAPRSCPGYVSFDLAPAINSALRRKDTRLTLALRIPSAREADPALGRAFTHRPLLGVVANHAPVVRDPMLKSPDRPCGTLRRHGSAISFVTLAATVVDPDRDILTGQFAIWPVTHPDQRREFGGSVYFPDSLRAEVDLSGYPHGTVVAWSARAFDQRDHSAWTLPCYVEVDRQAPVRAPVVASATYREGTQPPGHGGPGIAGTFRFDAQGDRDVVAYEYTGDFGAVQRVDARYPGAPVKIRYAPRRHGPQTLQVTAVDAAGNRGPATEYQFWVRDTAPSVTVDVAGVGLLSRITMHSAAPDVTTFGYQVPGGTEIRVPAVDGVGRGDLTFTRTGFIAVTSRSYAGSRVIGVSVLDVLVSDAPTVESADFNLEHDAVMGREGSFTFRPRTTGVVAFLYSFGGAEERIAAGPDATAVLRWTPAAGGWHNLWVRSVKADGGVSDQTSYQFNVIDPRPDVYSPDLVVSPRRDGVGVPIEFVFSSRMPDVTGFVYRLNDGPERSVPADVGFARVAVTPDHAGDNTIVVQSRFADGTLSPVTAWPFQISSAPVVSSADYPTGPGGQTGKPGVFRFRPGLPGVVEYRYAFDGGEEQGVPAGADATASVTFTPTRSGYQTVTVFSRDAHGSVSETRTYEFIVRDPRVFVSGWYDEYSPRGGIGVPGTFSFHTELFGEVVEYRYRVNGGAEETVPASTEGTSTYVPIAPDRNGLNTVSVQSRTAVGDLSPVTEYRFQVGTAPLVTSDQYPSGVWSGGVGVPGTFRFSGGTAGIVQFEYKVNDGNPSSVPADAGGVGTGTFTPIASGEQTMVVHGRKADGTVTDATTYYFLVQP